LHKLRKAHGTANYIGLAVGFANWPNAANLIEGQRLPSPARRRRNAACPLASVN
jgi:hypothetical protein